MMIISDPLCIFLLPSRFFGRRIVTMVRRGLLLLSASCRCLRLVVFCFVYGARFVVKFYLRLVVLVKGLALVVAGVLFGRKILNIGADMFGAFAAIAGGLLQRKAQDDQAYENRRSVEAQNRHNEAVQREFAQHGVRWRVEDAEAAGLHPLYALGAQGSSFTPNPITVNPIYGDPMGKAVSDAGQSFSRAVSAQETPQQRELALLQLERLRQATATDFAQEQSIWSQMALREQAAMNAKPWPADVVVGAYGPSGPIESHPLFQDAVKLSPDDMISRNRNFPAQTAGRDHPSMREFVFPGGHKVLLPATGQGGIPEEIDAAMLPHIWAANRQRYGEGWTGEALRYVLFAKGPKEYPSLRGPTVSGRIRY